MAQTPPSKWKLDTPVEREATEHGSVGSTEHGSHRSTEHGSVRSTNKIPFINKIPSSNISSNSLLDSHAKTLDAIEDGSLAARRTENPQSGDPENERLPLASIQTATSLATVPNLLEVQAIAPACNMRNDGKPTKSDPFTTRKNARDYARSRAKEASLFEKGRKNKRWETMEQFKAFQAYIAIYLKNNQQAIEKSSGEINDTERYSQALLWRTATAEDENCKELMCWKTWISDRPPLPIIEPQPQPEPVSDPFSRLAPDLQARIIALRATVAEQKARKEAQRLKWEAKDRAYAS